VIDFLLVEHQLPLLSQVEVGEHSSLANVAHYNHFPADFSNLDLSPDLTIVPPAFKQVLSRARSMEFRL